MVERGDISKYDIEWRYNGGLNKGLTEFLKAYVPGGNIMVASIVYMLAVTNTVNMLAVAISFIAGIIHLCIIFVIIIEQW